MKTGIFNKKKIKDFIVYGLGQAINILSPLLVLPYLVAKCGVEEVGKVGVGMSMALILNGIIDYGSYINGVKEISINRDNREQLEKQFVLIYSSRLLLLLIVLSVISLAILAVPYLAEDKTLLFLSLPIVLGQFINPTWFFQGIENFKWISLINVLSKSIYIGLVFILIKSQDDYVLANLFLGLGAIIANTIGFWWLITKYSFSIKKFEYTGGVNILKEEFNFSLSQFFLSMYQFFPIILISYLGGDLMAGQFRIIDQIVSVFKTYLNMFFYFVYANICFELHKNYKNGIKVWKQYNVFNFIVLSAALFIFYLFAPYILLFFKIDHNQFPDLVGYFRIALIIPLLIAISLPLRQLMFAFDLNNVYIIITISVTILNFIVLTLLTNFAGLAGTFFSGIIIELIVIVSYVYILIKYSKRNTIN